MGTDFFWKVIRYWMHGTCARFSGYLLLSISLPLSPVLTVSTTFFLVAITSMKIAKTDSSFLTLFWALEILIGIIPFLMTVKASNLRDVFLFFFDDINISTRCSQVMAITLFLSSSTPRNSLVVLVLFVSLALIDKRLWLFATRYISDKNVNWISLAGVFLLLFCRPVPLRIL